MASVSRSDLLHFPQEDTILAYLAKHPLTSNNTETKINETVSKFFANREQTASGVDELVMFSLGDMNEKLGLPEIKLLFIQQRVTAALKDCANGRLIEVEKK